MHVMIEGKVHDFPAGCRIIDMAKEVLGNKYSRVLAATLDNKLVNLGESVRKNCDIHFIDLGCEDGERIYSRSIAFVLSKALYNLYPEAVLTVEHSLGNGLYCEVNGLKLTQPIVSELEGRTARIIEQDLPITYRNMNVNDVKNIFAGGKYSEKTDILEYKKGGLAVYSLGGYSDFFYGPVVPSTGYLRLFALKYYLPGLLLLYPHMKNPDALPEFKDLPKLSGIFKESENWGKILDIGYASSLNRYIESGEAGDIILISEALHEKKIAEIADMITKNIGDIKLICIAGPSSSGKTSFARRLGIQLRVNGLMPISISLDNFYLPRELCPKDKNGEYDFESIDALDLSLFNASMASLIQGSEVRLPVFSFKTGIRQFTKPIKLNTNQPVIIEGIHGLNERLTSSIPKNMKFKIYISALTQLNIDESNRIPTTYSRLIRRIVRDHSFRGADALITLSMWNDVRKGEEDNIFPYQEEADVMFNSFLPYELPVLKRYAQPLLSSVPHDKPEYAMASILLDILSCFLPMDDEAEAVIPHNSLLREFIGDSCFDVY